jgi:hypothetical protein
VSGSAIGLDTWAKEAACKRGLSTKIFRPDLHDVDALSQGQMNRRSRSCGRQRIDGARDRPDCQNQSDQGQGPQDEVTPSPEAHHRSATRVSQHRCKKSECEGHREQIGCGRYRRLLDNCRRSGQQRRKVGNPWYLCCDVTGGDSRSKRRNGKSRRGKSRPTALCRAPIRRLGQSSSKPQPCNPRPKRGKRGRKNQCLNIQYCREHSVQDTLPAPRVDASHAWLLKASNGFR